MKLKIVLFFMVFSLMGSFSSVAQIRSILREKAREAIRDQGDKEEERIEEERREKREQERDQPRRPSAFEQRMQNRMKQAMGLADLDFEEQYRFSSSMVMDVESFDPEEDEKSEMKYTMYFNEDDNSFAMRFAGENQETGRNEESLMIFDMKNHILLILSEADGEKNGIAFSIASDSLEAEPDFAEQTLTDEEISEFDGYDQFHSLSKKTGRTRTISGYKCEEYVMEDDEQRTEYWLSPDAMFDYSGAWGYMGGMQALTMGTVGLNGLLMEINYTDKLTNGWSKMVVREIDPDTPNNIDVTGFSVIGFAGNPNQ
jgi:hypothetical protein